MMSFVLPLDLAQNGIHFEQQSVAALSVPFAGFSESTLSIASTASSGSNGAAEYDTDTATSDKSTADTLRGSEPIRQDTIEHPDLFRCMLVLRAASLLCMLCIYKTLLLLH